MSFRVVGLISGGKDSIFNLIHCQQNGHELVCLANLYPHQMDCEEMDNYMYQTVGHDVIPMIAQCMDLPLVREPLSDAHSSQSGSDASDRDQNDLGALYRLLYRVKQQYPHVDAVSVGAIASDYQRVRVESVCSRLGLRSLSYLWNQPQIGILRQMLRCNMKILIVKTAAYGLDADKYLGKIIDDKMVQSFTKMNTEFGFHVAGEGGEYETLVLDCPLYSHGSIVLHEVEVPQQIKVDEYTSYIKLSSSNLQIIKRVYGSKSELEMDVIPPKDFIINEMIAELAQFLKSGLVESSVAQTLPINTLHLDDMNASKQSEGQLVRESFQLKVKDPSQYDQEVFQFLSNAKMQFINADQQQQIVMVNVKLRDLPSNFARFNAQYKRCFEQQYENDYDFTPDMEPPCRACVGCDNMDCDVELEVTAYKMPVGDNIKCLSKLCKMHVQSLSYWAPCNIGPYSQLISIPSSIEHGQDGSLRLHCGKVYIAGQIGLIPEMMKLADGILQQMYWALLNTFQVLNAGLYRGVSLRHFDGQSFGFILSQWLEQNLFLQCICYYDMEQCKVWNLKETWRLCLNQLCGIARDQYLPFIAVPVQSLPMNAAVELVCEFSPADIFDSNLLTHTSMSLSEQAESQDLVSQFAIKYVHDEYKDYSTQLTVLSGKLLSAVITQNRSIDTDSLKWRRCIDQYRPGAYSFDNQLTTFDRSLNDSSKIQNQNAYGQSVVFRYQPDIQIYPSGDEVRVIVLRRQDDRYQSAIKSRLQALGYSKYRIDFIQVLDVKVSSDYTLLGIDQLSNNIIVVSSQNAVNYIKNYLMHHKSEAETLTLKFAVVGPQTAQKLQTDLTGLIRHLEIVQVENCASELAESLVTSSELSSQSFLHLCGDTRRDDLSSRLTQYGLQFSECVVYRSECRSGEQVRSQLNMNDYQSTTIKTFVFGMSPLGVSASLDIISRLSDCIVWIAIGQSSASKIQELQQQEEESKKFWTLRVAEEPQPDSMCKCIF
ncbi:hypothetical protein MP228_003139 [Amoeboaphelidium protococcarum]|nr:hypothetical protein MP228_003139 [Amoeboaphelidium protococcarum]